MISKCNYSAHGSKSSNESDRFYRRRIDNYNYRTNQWVIFRLEYHRGECLIFGERSLAIKWNKAERKLIIEVIPEYFSRVLVRVIQINSRARLFAKLIHYSDFYKPDFGIVFWRGD